MENNDYELEKQKFELEKQKLELEKQKLDFEKSKFDHKTSSVLPKSILEQFSQDSQEKNTRSSYLLALIASGVLAITPFLPWVESHVGGFGFSFSGSANGFECGHGYYILLFAIAALVLAFMKNRLVFIPGVLALIDGIAVVSHIGSNSISFMGASGGAGFAIGPVIVIISSLVLIASPFIPKLRMNSANNAKSIDIKSLFIKYKFQLLVSLTGLLILKPIFTNDGEYLYHWFWFFLFITVFCIIPILLLKYLKFTKTYKLLFVLPIFYLFGFISYSSNILNYGEQRSQFLNNFSDSYSKASPWFSYIFYTLILVIFVVEIIEQKKKEILPSSIDKYKFVFKPVVPLAAFFIPFICYFYYYSVTRHQITNEEARNFENLNSYYSGDWYFMNQDSSVIFKFTVPPVTTGERYNTGLLQAKFSYKMQKNDGHNLGEETFDTTMQYGTKLELPLKYESGLEITSLKDSILCLKIKLSDGNLMQVNCVKNNTPFVLITKKKEIKNTAELIKKSIEQFNEINSSYDLTKKFTLVSGDCHDDGCTFAFQNSDEGETQYASKLPENSVKFENTEEGGTTVQKKFLNKQYLIKYHLKKIFHEESNSASLEMLISEMKMVR